MGTAFSKRDGASHKRHPPLVKVLGITRVSLHIDVKNDAQILSLNRNVISHYTNKNPFCVFYITAHTTRLQEHEGNNKDCENKTEKKKTYLFKSTDF